jgi:histidine ammonia-lyase
MSVPETLTGADLTPESLARICCPGTQLALSADGRARMARARAVVEAAVAEGRPVYGVTTGLGSRATEALPEAALAGFSVETLHGRAHALGEPLPAETVRAAMAVRLNTLLRGAAGLSPALADHLLAVFNAGLTPVVGEWGSIGAADLVLGATMGRAVCGLGGEMTRPDGTRLAAQDALAEAGLTAPSLGPKDGLSLANHTCFSAGAAALAVAEAGRLLDRQTEVAALSLLAFQANLTPMVDAVLALKPHPGDRATAERLRALLAGEAICDPANARRLQDPVSLRNAPQILGAAHDALDYARRTVTVEINAAGDNPAVLPESGEVLSTGNYHTPHLTLACETAARALAGVAVSSLGRLVKLCTERLSGLPQYLADPEVGTNGFAPPMKLAESLLAGIQHAAQPTAPWPSVNADGVEDCLTNAMLAAGNLARVVELSRRLTALEALAAAQACDLRGTPPTGPLAALYTDIRALSPRIRESRPLAAEIEALATYFGRPGLAPSQRS